MEDRIDALDKKVRFHVYDTVMKSGKIPTAGESADVLSQSEDEIKESFKRLADAHILVLQRGSGEILMANPFSAVPTPYLVRAGERSFYGNCIWDAMGIPAMLGQNASIEASCGCCSTAMNLEIKNGEIENPRGIAHFAISAKRWWDDIVYN
ncbi:MAG: organomercurial lyase [Pyrinomonadaceae bacterium]